MTVNELLDRLNELKAQGCGEYVVLDTDAHDIIAAIVSDDDVEAGLNRVYIEAEF